MMTYFVRVYEPLDYNYEPDKNKINESNLL